MDYRFKGMENLITPALIYYKDEIERNTDNIISIVGDAKRLWPHVKTHKCANVVKLLMRKGIRRFKCATIAEAEMVASCGSTHIILAYPLVGVNIRRFVNLVKAYPEVKMYAIGDDIGQIKILSDTAIQNQVQVNFLADVNMGMDRTGVEISFLKDFVEKVASLPGISFEGFHCYDGNRHEHDYRERKRLVDETYAKLQTVKKQLERCGIACAVCVAGGSPSFPCYASKPEVYCSPGTIFINDNGYYNDFPDIDNVPAAAILTRVISAPKRGVFTIDLGYKSIASDPVTKRGRIVGLQHCRSVLQNEEHWVFKMESGFEDSTPQVGDELFVIPQHICPTSALYPSVIVVENGEIVDEWQITARDRKITF